MRWISYVSIGSLGGFLFPASEQPLDLVVIVDRHGDEPGLLFGEDAVEQVLRLAASSLVSPAPARNRVQIATLGADVSGYLDTGLEAGKYYVYRVRAVKPGGASAYSNKDHARTPLTIR